MIHCQNQRNPMSPGLNQTQLNSAGAGPNKAEEYVAWTRNVEQYNDWTHKFNNALNETSLIE